MDVNKNADSNENEYYDPEVTVESDAPWYVIQTIGRKELELAGTIHYKVPRDLYVRCWIPTKTERRKYQGERVDIKRHLLPGYVFISTSHPQKVIEALKKKRSYIRILGNDGKMTPLKDDEVELLQRLTGWNKDMPDNVDVSIGVIENGKLRVVDGPLFGLEKYVVKIDRHKMRAIVKMKLLGEERKFSFALVVMEKS